MKLSRLYGAERVEDYSLLEHLLALPVDLTAKSDKKNMGLPICTGDSLPEKFQQMLEQNTELANLWQGTGINAFYQHVRKLGLTAKDGSPFRFHDLRHVYATNVRDLGISLDDLRLLLGHQDRSTTDRYVTYDRKAVGEYLSALSRLRK